MLSSCERGLLTLISYSHEISLDESLIVYVVKIYQIKNLASVHPMYEGSNPLVEMKLESKDSSVRDQTQRTSYKPLTTSPEWTPPERFEFFTNRADPTILSQLHFTMSEFINFRIHITQTFVARIFGIFREYKDNRNYDTRSQWDF